MTEDGNPLENAIAESINGILEHEYLHHYSIKNKTEAIEILNKVVAAYNQQRPHLSCSLDTPETFIKRNFRSRGY